MTESWSARLNAIRARRRSASHRYRLPFDDDIWADRLRAAVRGRRLAAVDPAAAVETATRALLCVERGGAEPEAASRCEIYRSPVQLLDESDIWGWLAPGRPELAASWACAAAFGVAGGEEELYAALFAAALAAAAFITEDPAEALHIGAGEIPDDSRVAAAVRAALQQWAAGEAPTFATGGTAPESLAFWTATALVRGAGDWKAALAVRSSPFVGAIIGAQRGTGALPGNKSQEGEPPSLSGPGSADPSVDELARRTLAAARWVLAADP
ncbi:MAG TPA: ADP-ribosylglycohydrolase family protein [Limnochordia bacterium]